MEEKTQAFCLVLSTHLFETVLWAKKLHVKRPWQPWIQENAKCLFTERDLFPVGWTVHCSDHSLMAVCRSIVMLVLNISM